MGDDLRTRKCQAARRLGEEPVEADHHANAARGGVHHGGRRVAGEEDILLAVEEVELAVVVGRAIGADEHGRIVAAFLCALGIARDDDGVAFAGEFTEEHGGGAVVEGLGESVEFVAIAEVIAREGELGEDE